MCSIFHSSMRWCPSMSCIMQCLAQLVPHKNPYLDGFFTRGRAASDAWWETHDQMASFGSMGIFGIRAPKWPKAKSLFDPLGPWAGPSSLDEPVDLAECAWSWRHKLDRCSRLLSLSARPILPLGCLFSATAAELAEPRHGSHFDETCQPKNPVPDVGSIPTSAPTRLGIWSHLWFKPFERFERFKLLVCKFLPTSLVVLRLSSYQWSYIEATFGPTDWIWLVCLQPEVPISSLSWEGTGIRCSWAVPARMASSPKQTSLLPGTQVSDLEVS